MSAIVVLPEHVRVALIEASKIESSKLPGTSKERMEAIEEIVRIAKINYPNAFIKGNYRDKKKSINIEPTSFNEFLGSVKL